MMIISHNMIIIIKIIIFKKKIYKFPKVNLIHIIIIKKTGTIMKKKGGNKYIKRFYNKNIKQKYRQTNNNHRIPKIIIIKKNMIISKNFKLK